MSTDEAATPSPALPGEEPTPEQLFRMVALARIRAVLAKPVEVRPRPRPRLKSKQAVWDQLEKLEIVTARSGRHELGPLGAACSPEIVGINGDAGFVDSGRRRPRGLWVSPSTREADRYSEFLELLELLQNDCRCAQDLIEVADGELARILRVPVATIERFWLRVGSPIRAYRPGKG